MVSETLKLLKPPALRRRLSLYSKSAVDVVYLDNNATTQPDPLVVEAMLPWLTEKYGNPSSAHRMGQTARAAVDESRAKLARLVGCRDSELTFTGGGTEASNTALRGLFANRNRDGSRPKIVTTAAEHSATRETVKALQGAGAEVVEVPVDGEGLLDFAGLAEAVDERTTLVTTIWANNETGVVNDVAPIAQLCRERKVPFHCDATQAIGKLPVNFHELGVDCATMAAHKFHGPKGIGALYVRRGMRVPPLVVGGPQEREKRGGTENVAGIVGMGVAAELAATYLPDMASVAKLRDDLERRALETCGDVRVNGSTTHRLPNTTNLGFKHLQAEAILLMLSERGVCASAGAACSSGSLEPSHVLRAMGVPEAYAHGSVRFSLSRLSTPADVDALLDVLPDVVDRLRSVLPVADK